MQKPVLPPHVEMALQHLEDAGFEAFLVGGCVRDLLMHREPHDWDITTSALPEETSRVFASWPQIHTGFRHGTVMVLTEGHQPLEITTYRMDGTYSDGRHPDGVTFSRQLTDDLSRRDFTMNACALGRGHLADPFGGQADIAAGCIRTVGDATTRFQEDALRILRGMRFASTLGFRVDAPTALAMHQCAPLLSKVSGERTATELKKILCGPFSGTVLDAFFPVLETILPELAPMRGFDQCSPRHDSTLDIHTFRALQAAEPDALLRLALLFHDAGKPSCMTRDSEGNGHFSGHPEISASLAEHALSRLRLSNADIREVACLIRCHDQSLAPETRAVRRLLSRLGEPSLRKLFALRRADILAQNPGTSSVRLEELEAAEREMEGLIAGNACVTLSGLAVRGQDLLTLGLPPGPLIGRTLNLLLESVLTETCDNTREALLTRAEELQHLEVQRLPATPDHPLS